MLRGEYEISVYLLRLLLDICTYVLNGPTIPCIEPFHTTCAENGILKVGGGKRRIYPDGDYLLASRPCATAYTFALGHVKSRSNPLCTFTISYLFRRSL